MTPDNTHHDTLGVYYNFLEDSGFDTEELRGSSSKISWYYEYWIFRCDNIGTFSTFTTFSKANAVGGYFTSRVGANDDNDNPCGTGSKVGSNLAENVGH